MAYFSRRFLCSCFLIAASTAASFGQMEPQIDKANPEQREPEGAADRLEVVVVFYDKETGSLKVSQRADDSPLSDGFIKALAGARITGWNTNGVKLNLKLFVACGLADSLIDLGAAYSDYGGDYESLSKFAKLEVLDLSFTDSTNEVLPALKKMPNLRSLYLYGNEAIDVKLLDIVSGMEKLELLDIRGTTLLRESEPELKRWKKKHPDVLVLASHGYGIDRGGKTIRSSDP